MCRKLLYLISFVFVLGLVIANTTEAQDDPNLIGWWKLDETSGTVAADSSGYGNDGTVVGGGPWVSGYIDGALDFDGDDAWVGTSKGLGHAIGKGYYPGLRAFKQVLGKRD